MQAKPPVAARSFESLKTKQRRLRGGFPEAVGLRVHRAISWFGRAMAETDDPDVRFILLWVGFNAAYARALDADAGERGSFKGYFEQLVALDTRHRIYDAVWERFSQEIRTLLANKYVFAPFWHHQNGVPGHEKWERHLASSQREIAAAITRFDTATLLRIVFDRLYMLRNQLVHGGATWKSGVNRTQVRDGAAVLAWMLPLFIDLMMDHPDRDWGRPYYPVVEL